MYVCFGSDGVNIKENTIYCFNDGVIEDIEESC